jgi:PAS domain S-box-containing protein
VYILEQIMAPETYVSELEVLRNKLAAAESALSQWDHRLQGGYEQFRLLAESSPFFIWMAGPDALCTYANRAWLEMRGRKLTEELGNGWMEGLHPDDRDLCLEIYLKAFSARQPFRQAARAQRANGEYAWVEASGCPSFDAGSSFLGYIVSGLDITQLKRPVFAPDPEAVRIVFALTERERQVLALIAQGKSTKETATCLGISYKTADSHRSRILEKLGVHETASMVRYAIRAGLIEA